MLIKDEFFMTLMKLRLDFLFKHLSQHFGINLVVLHSSFLLWKWVRGDVKSSVL